ncbi:MAG: HAD hydrolase-like protein [Actinomycetota bacterium]|nr:HAD hydrolase-like protein [Actinomycetota bacterium]
MADPVVLFDVDGTLVDTNYLHTVSWRRAFLDAGADVPAWRIHRMIGASSSVLIDELLGDGVDDNGTDVDPSKIKDTWRSHYESLVPEIKAFPGAADLLRAVAAEGGKVVLATSSPGDLVEHNIDALGIDRDLLAAVTTA